MNLRMLIDPAQSEPKHEKVTLPDPDKPRPAETIASLLASIRKQWRLCAAITAVGFGILAAALLFMAPIFTAEATLELNFNREDAQSTTVNRQVASMDPGALVNGAADRIASRSNAMRAAKSLGMDEQFRQRSLLSKGFGLVRRMLGIYAVPPTPLELAAEYIQQNVKVTYKSHLYNIGVAYTDYDPQHAADVANTLAIEYLRGERLKDLSEQRVTASQELAMLSDRLGNRHPRRAGVEARLERINADIAATEAAPSVASNFVTAGQFITMAEPVYIPASQKKPAIFMAGMGLILVLAAACGILMDRLRPQFDWQFPSASSIRKWRFE